MPREFNWKLRDCRCHVDNSNRGKLGVTFAPVLKASVTLREISRNVVTKINAHYFLFILSGGSAEPTKPLRTPASHTTLRPWLCNIKHLQNCCKKVQCFILHVTPLKNLAKHFQQSCACCQIFMSQCHCSQSQCFLGSLENDVVLRRDAITQHWLSASPSHFLIHFCKCFRGGYV